MCFYAATGRGRVKMDANTYATVNALLNEIRSHEGLRVPRSDMPFTMDVDVGYDGYGGLLC